MGMQVNRAEILWKNWEDKQRELEAITDFRMDEKENLKFKYDFLRQGMYRIAVNPSEKEKLYLHIVKTATAKLEKRLYPGLYQRAMHRIGLQFTKAGYLRQFEENKVENLASLKADFKAVGLDFFSKDLQSYLDYESPQVSIGVQTRLSESDGLRIIVEMEKDKFGSYLFNGYSLIHTDNERTSNTVHFSKESQVSLTEAVNLLQGRAVLKSYMEESGTVSRKWMQLNFNDSELKLETFPQKTDYDLKEVLVNHGTQLDFYGFTKEAVQRSLEQGNLVGFEIKEQKFHLQANPIENNIKFLDQDKKPVTFSGLKEQVNSIGSEKQQTVRLIKQKNVQEEHQLYKSR